MNLSFAISGARIVTGPDSTIESGTVVLRDGLIDAVGAAGEVPPDAHRIDGVGLTVYPGLIDLGNTQLAEEAPLQPPQDVRTLAELESWKRLQYLRPHARAADVVTRAHPILTAWAAAGITSVLALPSGQVIAGQSALVDASAPDVQSPIGNVVNPRGRARVMKTPVALHVSFPVRQHSGGLAYPASLMGVVAFVRQAFLDARHDAFQAARPGGRLYDPALEAMQEALGRTLPVAFEANTAQEILRALRMARELELDPIVTGGREAGDVAADLRTQGARVIYSLNYPSRPCALAPGADEPLRRLRSRVLAPSVPARLAQAGVLFAFASAGLSDPEQFIENAGKAVKAGLPRDEAVRALTIGAAAIAGEQDRLGTIEKGKIANLVVTRGDLFDDTMAVACVFVHGEPIGPVSRKLSYGEQPVADTRLPDPGRRDIGAALAAHAASVREH